MSAITTEAGSLAAGVGERSRLRLSGRRGESDSCHGKIWTEEQGAEYLDRDGFFRLHCNSFSFFAGSLTFTIDVEGTGDPL
jgi:hypothetical protein